MLSREVQHTSLVLYSTIIMASYVVRGACPWRPFLKATGRKSGGSLDPTHKKLILSAFFFLLNYACVHGKFEGSEANL